MAPRKYEIPRLRYIRGPRFRRCLLLDASTGDLKSTTGRGDSFNRERYRDKRINRFSRKGTRRSQTIRSGTESVNETFSIEKIISIQFGITLEEFRNVASRLASTLISFYVTEKIFQVIRKSRESYSYRSVIFAIS